MKTNLKVLAALALVGSLAMTACGNKENKGGDGGGGQTPPPPAPIVPTVLADGFDNSYGMNPLRSIKATSIRNMQFELRDASGTNLNTTFRVQLQFDGQGLLNGIATVDMSSFDPSIAGALDSDPFSNYRATQSGGINHQVIIFKGSNIPYSFDRQNGVLVINNFVLGSNVPAQGLFNQQPIQPQPGQTVQPPTVQPNPVMPTNVNGRMALAIRALDLKQRSMFHGHVQFTGGRYKSAIRAEISNLSGLSDDSDIRHSANPTQVGFEITSDLSVAPGVIQAIPVTNFQMVNGGQVQPTQTTRDEFGPAYGSNISPVFYRQPNLDPRAGI